VPAPTALPCPSRRGDRRHRPQLIERRITTAGYTPSVLNSHASADDPLDARALRRALGAAARNLEVRVINACESTNAVLLAAEGPGPMLLAAELQTAGRGRRGRRWHSPRGTGLTFSLARRFEGGPARLSGLSIAIGVAVARALRARGAATVGLKWPNDLVAGGAKLGGILVETRNDGAGTRVVAGIGINCRSVAGLGMRTRRRVTALDALGLGPIDRNRFAAGIALEVLATLRAFESNGLDAIRVEWEALHAYAGQRLRLRLADGRRMTGIAEGLAADGGLRLRTRTGVHAIAGARVLATRPA
jgi:BirA family biotin operon repressor/biotin-[acetyl-CoA-carboxylase] ligase